MFDFKATIENELVKIQPLKESDFNILYSIASDPLLWEQHPNPDRYKKEIFETFFKGAMESEAAFLVFDKQSNAVIGSSRYYDLNTQQSTIAIGYTFIARSHWGTSYNRALKDIMLNHAFQFVKVVILHIGANNIRSQKATEKLGAKKIAEIEMEYYGEANRLNFVYEIRKEDWNN